MEVGEAIADKQHMDFIGWFCCLGVGGAKPNTMRAREAKRLTALFTIGPFVGSEIDLAHVILSRCMLHRND